MRNATQNSLSDIFVVLTRHKKRWLIPTAVATVLAMGYAVVRPTSWEASQGLIVRDESNSKPDRPGRFANPEDMKTIQETVLELAKSRTMLAEALKAVGPASEIADPEFPTDKDVTALQGAVKITPPKGLEFGKTEVFYLKVQSNNRDRAIALTEKVCEELQKHFAKLRNDKAEGLINELTKSVSLNRADLETVTARLTTLEKQVGSDLAELRMLNESPSGDSDLRRRTTEMENELRQARTSTQTENELLLLLEGTNNDPTKLLATPSKLLDSQAGLRRLKDGLLEAQLRTAQLAGTVSPQHPQYLAAKINEDEVKQQLRGELDTAIQGLKIEHKLTLERVATLERLLTEARDRIKALGAIRADYGNVVAEVRQRSEISKNAQQMLAEAKANQAGANVTSMITRIDTPDIGSGPIGPSRSQTVVLGACVGLILGLGILFLTTAPNTTAPNTAVPANNGIWSDESVLNHSAGSSFFGNGTLSPSPEIAFSQGGRDVLETLHKLPADRESR